MEAMTAMRRRHAAAP